MQKTRSSRDPERLMATADTATHSLPISEASAGGVSTTAAAAVCLAFGPSVIGVLSFSVFINPIETAFGWTRVEVSLAVTIISYVIMLVSPIQGMLVDRFGPRRTVLTSIPLFAGSLSLFYLLPDSLVVFYVFAALLPLLGIGLWPLSYLQVVSGWFERRLGLALGLANAGIGIGSTLVPLIVSAMLVAYGWREAFLGLAGIVLLLTWPVAWFGLRENGTSGDGAAAVRPTFGLSFAEAVKERSFRLLIVIFFLLGITTTALITQQVPMLIDAGWAPQRAAAVMSVFGAALMVARVGVGFVIDYVFAPLVLLVITVGGAAACLLYASFPAAAFVAAALLGLVVGAEFDVLAFLVKRYFGTAAFGRLYGTVFAAFQLAGGLGIVALSTSQQSFGNYATGLYVMAAALALCAALQAFLGRYRFDAAAPGAQAQAIPGEL
jgi:MFS family permease